MFGWNSKPKEEIRVHDLDLYKWKLTWIYRYSKQEGFYTKWFEQPMHKMFYTDKDMKEFMCLNYIYNDYEIEELKENWI